MKQIALTKGKTAIVDGKNLYLGAFTTELAAAQAREDFIASHPELHARSNFG